MKNKYSKKQMEELYNCEIFKDSGFDDRHLFWTAHGLPLTEDGEDNLFTYADGWNLNELHENIREAIREYCIRWRNGGIKIDRLGEVNKNSHGTLMKIIRYGDWEYIDVQFQDGFYYIKEHQTYSNL